MNTGTHSKIIDGKAVAAKIRKELADKVSLATGRGLHPPHLGAILVGHDGGSESYVSGKMKACEEAGFASTLLRLPDSVTEEELLRHIHEWNEDRNINGFIVQLPLPSHIDSQKVLDQVSPEKDVDGFHPINIGKMMLGIESYIPATPMGIVCLLKEYGIETAGKHVVVIGRSNIVGTPVSVLLSRNTNPGNATVTLTHSRTKNIDKICREADIIIAAIGKPGFLTGDMVKEGAVVIDVGTTRVKDDTRKSGFRLAGDADFESVSQKTSFITPVPGGVGPMTIASLLLNTYKAWQQQLPTL